MGVMMLGGFGKGDGERKGFGVCKIKGIGGVGFFGWVIGELLGGGYRGSVGWVKMES